MVILVIVIGAIFGTGVAVAATRYAQRGASLEKAREIIQDAHQLTSEYKLQSGVCRCGEPLGGDCFDHVYDDRANFLIRTIRQESLAWLKKS